MSKRYIYIALIGLICCIAQPSQAFFWMLACPTCQMTDFSDEISSATKTVGMLAKTASETKKAVEYTLNNFKTAAMDIYQGELPSLIKIKNQNRGIRDVVDCTYQGSKYSMENVYDIYDLTNMMFSRYPGADVATIQAYDKARTDFYRDSIIEIYTAANLLQQEFDKNLIPQLDATKKCIAGESASCNIPVPEGNSDAVFVEANAVEALDNLYTMLLKVVALKAQLASVKSIHKNKALPYIEGSSDQEASLSPKIYAQTSVSKQETLAFAQQIVPSIKEGVSTLSQIESKVSLDNSVGNRVVDDILFFNVAPPSPEAHAYIHEEEKLSELEKLTPIEEKVSIAREIHNRINGLSSYKELAKSMRKAREKYNQSLEFLKIADNCAYKYVSRHFKNADITWGKNKDVSDHDARTGISGWAWNAFETAKAVETFDTSSSNVATLDIDADDFGSEDVLNTEKVRSAVNTDENQNINKNSEEKLEEESRKSRMLTWEIGAEASKMLAADSSKWGEPLSVPAFPIWQDTKSYYGEYIDLKYQNIKEYLKSFSRSDLLSVVSEALKYISFAYNHDDADKMAFAFALSNGKNRELETYQQRETTIIEEGGRSPTVTNNSNENKGKETTDTTNTTPSFGNDNKNPNMEEAIEFKPSDKTDTLDNIEKEEAPKEQSDDKKEGESSGNASDSSTNPKDEDNADTSQKQQEKTSEAPKSEDDEEGDDSDGEDDDDGEGEIVFPFSNFDASNIDITANEHQQLKIKQYNALEKEIQRLIEEDEKQAEERYQKNKSIIAIMQKKRQDLLDETDTVNKEIKRLKDELSDIRSNIHSGTSDEMTEKVTYMEPFPSSVDGMPVGGVTQYGVSDASADKAIFAKGVADKKEESKITELQLKIKNLQNKAKQIEEEIVALDERILQMRLRMVQEEDVPSELDNLITQATDKVANIISKSEKDFAQRIKSKIISQLSNPEAKTNVRALLLYAALESAAGQALGDLYAKVDARVKQAVAEIKQLQDGMYMPENHAKIVEIHQSMVRDLKSMAVSINVSGLPSISGLMMYSKLMGTEGSKIEEEDYFVGKPAKKRDIRAPKAIFSNKLPPLREVFRFDEVDFRNVVPNVKGLTVSPSIILKDFLNYGGEIPEVWKHMLKRRSFVETPMDLQKALNLGCFKQSFFRKGIMPCQVANTSIVLDIDGKGNFIRTPLSGTFEVCPYIDVQKDKLYHQKHNVYLKESITINPTKDDCEYSELGSLFEQTASGNIRFRKEVYDSFYEMLNETAEQELNDSQKNRLAVLDMLSLSQNQIGDFLTFAENEQKQRQQLQEMEAEFKVEIDDLFNILRKYGFEPNPNIDLSQEKDFNLIRNGLDSIKNQKISEAKMLMSEVNIQDNKVVEERLDGLKELIETMEKDREELTVVYGGQNQQNTIDEDIKTSKVNQEAASKLQKELEAFEENTDAPTKPYCATY